MKVYVKNINTNSTFATYGRFGARRGSALKFIEDTVSAYNENCVDWPYSISSNGYARIKYKGKNTTAHRLALIFYTGTTKNLETAHNCSNKICINPLHLRWATSKENHADRIKDGTHERGEQGNNVKLTREEVLEIRNDNRVHSLIAKEYPVARQTITKIKARKRWGWL